MKQIGHKTPHIVWFHWYEMCGIDKSTEKVNLWLPRSRGRDGNWILTRTEFSLCVHKNVLELDGSEGFITLKIIGLCALNVNEVNG